MHAPCGCMFGYGSGAVEQSSLPFGAECLVFVSARSWKDMHGPPFAGVPVLARTDLSNCIHASACKATTASKDPLLAKQMWTRRLHALSACAGETPGMMPSTKSMMRESVGGTTSEEPKSTALDSLSMVGDKSHQDSRSRFMNWVGGDSRSDVLVRWCHLRLRINLDRSVVDKQLVWWIGMACSCLVAKH